MCAEEVCHIRHIGHYSDVQRVLGCLGRDQACADNEDEVFEQPRLDAQSFPAPLERALHHCSKGVSLSNSCSRPCAADECAEEAERAV